MNKDGIPSKKSGLQVVKLCESGEMRYSLDEEALRSVLLRPDVRERLVVLVSVAGAYRGGKSFILDLFLRYLTAPRLSQESGDWLEIEKEKLDGFEWRSGSDRHTTGIHLWPEPVLVDLPSGTKVAVLLMDTQGTFDHDSTLAENSMIFALSTLISSVQIYNLSGNIREDDLQHLQLFTEYGQLASEGKAFQTLIFLVRDWMHDDEHVYGFKGGDEMLQKRLQPKDHQKKELREVREHIRSCFDTIKCFLMPHPGLIVGRRAFTGCLNDLTEDFQKGLLELVPSLFDPDNMSVKLINGEPVKAKHLIHLFKNYVDIFNSDVLPEAMTIFQATADASMMSALRDSRDVYHETMDVNIQADLSSPQSCLRQWHDTAVLTALESFHSKKKLSSKEAIDTAQSQLAMELEARFATYTLQNEAKAKKSSEEAVNRYHDTIKGVCESLLSVCMHPVDLWTLHDRALQEALDYFDSTRVKNDDDEERRRLEQKLQEQYTERLCIVNEQNNKTAILKCRESYVTQMWSYLSRAGGLSTDLLQAQHEGLQAEVVASFLSHRDVPTEEQEDHFCQQLLQETTDVYSECKRMNENYNMAMVHSCFSTYNNVWNDVWSPRTSCFNPTAMQGIHATAKAAALEQFLRARQDSDSDDYKFKLIEFLEYRFNELKAINNTQNEQAVEVAFGKYRQIIDRHLQASMLDILIVPLVVRLATFGNAHTNAKNTATDLFKSNRLGETFSEDMYLAQLINRIEVAGGYYRQN